MPDDVGDERTLANGKVRSVPLRVYVIGGFFAFGFVLMLLMAAYGW